RIDGGHGRAIGLQSAAVDVKIRDRVPQARASYIGLSRKNVVADQVRVDAKLARHRLAQIGDGVPPALGIKVSSRQIEKDNWPVVDPEIVRIAEIVLGQILKVRYEV